MKSSLRPEIREGFANRNVLYICLGIPQLLFLVHFLDALRVYITTGQFPHLLYQACIDPTSHYSIPFYTLLPFQVIMTYTYIICTTFTCTGPWGMTRWTERSRIWGSSTCSRRSLLINPKILEGDYSDFWFVSLIHRPSLVQGGLTFFSTIVSNGLMLMRYAQTLQEMQTPGLWYKWS